MAAQLSATRAAALAGDFHRGPAYAGLAGALAVAIGDGRIPVGTRLPSERDLAHALDISRTTATRAYAELCQRGYAGARRGSGTYAQVPGGRAHTLDRALAPRAAGDDSVIDLNCAASSAPPGLAEAYAAAVDALPAYLSGHGYFPAGLPSLQARLAASFTRRGLPTTPEQVMVTSGALAAAAVAARATLRPGDRVVVETPGYPNAPQSFLAAGARLAPVPVDEAGWDLDLLRSRLRGRPRAAYLVPDFHNPTGRLMSDPEREDVGTALARSGTVTIIDETMQQLALEGQRMPRPLAATIEEAGGEALTVGGASKAFWGGLRIGWLRAPTSWLEALTRARLTLDLGAPVVEQLALGHLLDDPDPLVDWHRSRLRDQRDALRSALASQLPDWQVPRPAGGLALWCGLPRPAAVPLAAEAERRGVVVTPGPVFAPEGGYAGRVRIPFTRPAAELEAAVDVLAGAWSATGDATGTWPVGPPLVA